ncbi:MAG: hypothetical protein H7235_06995 [Bdellovibrionaceae bacterium]|nr:hypothetical protein [Pseudobdellovibrionaceae bacterium]
MLLKRLLLLVVWGFVLASCAKIKSNEIINDESSIKAQSLNGKILFLQKIINADGTSLNKEPYPYSINLFDYQGQQLTSIQQPRPDCNGTGNNWLRSNSNDYVSHSSISTAMLCNFKNNLANYYIFPNEFLLSFENESTVIITDKQKNTKAYFQLISDNSQLPKYNEPPVVPDSSVVLQ